MADPIDPSVRLALVEADNARLRRLLDEAGSAAGLRHSLRDTLAMLRAIMRQSAETADDVESYVAHLEGRLDAITRVRSTTDAFGAADLHAVISDALLMHLVREGEQAAVDGPRIRLAPKPVQVFALAVHELASNAVEHGGLGRPQGRVDATWRVSDRAAVPVVALVWKESGGRERIEPLRRGFGTAILEEMLAYELDAETVLAFEPDGLRCTIRFPLSERIGRLVDGEPEGSPF